VLIGASAAEVSGVYFDPATWPAWVDGFGSVDSSEGYPDTGGTLRWRSTPAGRGRVGERVLEHEPRRLHRIAFSDDASEGELTTRFEIEPAPQGEPTLTRVTQEIDYRLRRRGPFAPLTDFLFVRPQMQRSLARSLERLRHEVEELAEATPPGGAAPERPV
jgi:polyketide cyclase/dehydrase/lipid transport protein